MTGGGTNLGVGAEGEGSGPLSGPPEAARGGADWESSEESGNAVAWFEYTGRTALVLRGPYTGQRYWFKRPGARLQVDARDRHALLAVPVLRLVQD